MSSTYAKRCLLLATLGLLAQGLARAEAGNPLTDRFSLSLGTFLLSTDTQIRVDGATGSGTQIDTERDLGLNDTNRFRIDGYWRFKKRHKLRILYFDTERSATRTFDEDVQVGDTVFPVDAQVTSTFGTRVGELAYEYAFLRRENYEVSGSFGVHNLRFNLDMSASQTASGETLSLAREANANGPLPVLGFRGVWRLNDRFYLDGQAQFFKISLHPYDGRLEDYNASVVWTPLKHLALGAGYNRFVTRIDVEADRFNGNMRWRYSGGRIFVTASF